MTTIEQLTKLVERIERLLCCRLDSSKTSEGAASWETKDVINNISYTLRNDTGKFPTTIEEISKEKVLSGTSVTKITSEGPVTTYFDKDGEPLDESAVNILKGNDILRHDSLYKRAKRYSNLKYFSLHMLVLA